MRLQGKVALVTGAATGIGQAIAERFAAEGAAVGVNHVGPPDAAEAVVERIRAAGGRALAIAADVAVREQVAAMLDRCVAELGGLDVLVNNAGIESPAPFLEIDDALWDRILAVDLRGVFLCTQEAGRRMRDAGRGGAIVNISSIHEDATFPGFTPYCAAKGGVRMLMRNAALELAPLGIRCNNIAPGAIATPINQATLGDPAKLAELARIIPLGRMGEPAEVASLAVFLASDEAAYVTGSTYYVDGGMVRFAEPL